MRAWRCSLLDRSPARDVRRGRAHDTTGEDDSRVCTLPAHVSLAATPREQLVDGPSLGCERGTVTAQVVHTPVATAYIVQCNPELGSRGVVGRLWLARRMLYVRSVGGHTGPLAPTTSLAGGSDPERRRGSSNGETLWGQSDRLETDRHAGDRPRGAHVAPNGEGRERSGCDGTCQVSGDRPEGAENAGGDTGDARV